jgi:glyoxylase-like metal-dependent hydrolase (beta-lactamase superfamily II)
MEPKVHTLFESVTGTWQYIVADENAKDAVIIDSVLDYDKETGTVTTSSADEILSLVSEQGYLVSRIMETHAHADHLTASRYLQHVLAARQPQHAPPQVCIGHRIHQVQTTMARIYSVPESELTDTFDHTFADDEIFKVGSIEARVIHLPGHTPDHVGYVIGSNIFTGDSIFNPDVGSARCDFPGGSSTDLFHSTQKLLTFPGHFKLYTGHDYPPEGRDVAPGQHVEGSKAVPFTTVEAQSKQNKHVKLGTQMEEFVKWRTERDSGLADPKLFAQAMQTNIRGGRLPTTSSENFKLVDIPEHVAITMRVV